MNPWRRIGDQAVLYDGNWRRVLQKTFIMPNGHTMQAEISSSHCLESVMVVALTPEHQAIIARQFRCGPEQIFDELPANIFGHNIQTRLDGYQVTLLLGKKLHTKRGWPTTRR